MTRLSTNIIGTPQTANNAVQPGVAHEIMSPAQSVAALFKTAGEVGVQIVKKREELADYQLSLDLRTEMDLLVQETDAAMKSAKSSNDYAGIIANLETKFETLKQGATNIKTDRYRIETLSALQRAGGATRLQAEASLTNRIDSEIFAQEMPRVESILSQGIVSGEYEAAYSAYSSELEKMTGVLIDPVEAETLRKQAKGAIAMAMASDEMSMAAMENRVPNFKGIPALEPWMASQLRTQWNATVRHLDSQEDRRVLASVPRRLDQIAEIDNLFDQHDQVDALAAAIRKTGVPNVEEEIWNLKVAATRTFAERELARAWSAQEPYRLVSAEKMYRELAKSSRSERDGLESTYLEQAERFRDRRMALNAVIEAGVMEEAQSVSRGAQLAINAAIPMVGTPNQLSVAEVRELAIKEAADRLGVPVTDMTAGRFPLGEEAFLLVSDDINARLSSYERMLPPEVENLSQRLNGASDPGNRQYIVDATVGAILEQFNGQLPPFAEMSREQQGQLTTVYGQMMRGRVGLPAALEAQAKAVVRMGPEQRSAFLASLYDMQSNGLRFASKMVAQDIGVVQSGTIARYFWLMDQTGSHEETMKALETKMSTQELRQARYEALAHMSKEDEKAAVSELLMAIGLETDLAQGVRSSGDKAAIDAITQLIVESTTVGLEGDAVEQSPSLLWFSAGLPGAAYYFLGGEDVDVADRADDTYAEAIRVRAEEVLQEYKAIVAGAGAEGSTPTTAMERVREAYEQVFPHAGPTYLTHYKDKTPGSLSFAFESPEAAYGLVPAEAMDEKKTSEEREIAAQFKPDNYQLSGLYAATVRAIQEQHGDASVEYLTNAGVQSGAKVSLASGFKDHLKGGGFIRFEDGTYWSKWHEKLDDWAGSDMSDEELAKTWKTYVESGGFNRQAFKDVPGATFIGSRLDIRDIAKNFEFVRGSRMDQEEIDKLNRVSMMAANNGQTALRPQRDHFVYYAYLKDDDGRSVMGSDGKPIRYEIRPSVQDIYGNYYTVRQMQLEQGKGLIPQTINRAGQELDDRGFNMETIRALNPKKIRGHNFFEDGELDEGELWMLGNP